MKILLLILLLLSTNSFAKTEDSTSVAQPVAAYGTFNGVMVPLKVTADGTVITSSGSSQFVTTANIGIGTTSNVGIGTLLPEQKLVVQDGIIRIKNVGDIISGQTSQIDFSTPNIYGTTGALRVGSINGTNNEKIDLNGEATANNIEITSPTGVSNINAKDISLNSIQFRGGATQTVSATNKTTWLKMEENAASTAITDTMGTATCVASRNTSNWSAAGKINLGFTLASASTDFIDCGSTAGLKPTTAFTFETWLKTTSTGAMYIAGNRSAAGATPGWQLIKNSATHTLGLTFDVGSVNYVTTGTTDIHTGAWFHVVAGLDANLNSFIYVNGIQEGTSPDGAVFGDFNTSSGNTQIGSTPAGGGALTWNGSFDNVYLYVGRALTAAEIKEHYNAGVGTESDVGPQGCMMIWDTDLAGWTECFSLNGTLSCTIDADGICDGS